MNTPICKQITPKQGKAKAMNYVKYADDGRKKKFITKCLETG